MDLLPPDREPSMGDLADRWAQVDIRCRRCPRHGRLSTARLIRDYGRDAPVRLLFPDLGKTCPNWQSASPYDSCSLGCDQLVGIHRRPDYDQSVR
jgi:hypothetical protein